MTGRDSSYDTTPRGRFDAAEVSTLLKLMIDPSKPRIARFPYVAHAAVAEAREDLAGAGSVAGFQFHVGHRGFNQYM